MKNRIKRMIELTTKESIEKKIKKLNTLVSTVSYEQKLENRLAAAHTTIEILQNELKEILQEIENSENEKKC